MEGEELLRKKTVLEKMYSSQQIINYIQHLALPPIIVVNIFDTDGWGGCVDPAQSIGWSCQLQDLLLSLPYFCIALIPTVCPSVLTLNLFIPGDCGSTG